MINGYIFFKLLPFCIRRGYLNPDWICYCWNDKTLIESSSRMIVIGGLMTGWLKLASGNYSFVAVHDGRVLVGNAGLNQEISA